MSPQTSLNNERIAKNTLLLYVRMLFMMAVTLYTSRVVLATLGVEDYGIYNVVGGIVAMLGFLHGSMSNTVQRFLSVELGRGNEERVNQVFNASLQVHYAIAFFVLFVMEIVGVWYLRAHLNIPAGRISAANWVLQCSIITTFFTIVQVPYNAMIIAKERMEIYAYLSILDVTLKLLTIYLLQIGHLDKLKLYSVLVAVVTIGVQLIYRAYCSRVFEEIRFRWIKDIQLIKELLSFSVWNMLSEVAWTFTGPGVIVIQNIFYGPAINAAMGLANQVNGAVSRFIGNFQTAVNPQIIKLCAAEHTAEMKRLLFRSTRFSFYLMLLLSLPLILKMHYVLELWLRDVPEYTTEFCQLTLVYTLVSVTSTILPKIVWAHGNIRNYQIITSLIIFLNFPLSYLVLWMGASPLSVTVVGICIQVVMVFVRIYLVCEIEEMQMREFLLEAILPIVRIGLLSLVLPLLVLRVVEENFLGFLIVAVTTTISTGSLIYFVGMDSHERKFVMNKVVKVKNKLT